MFAHLNVQSHMSPMRGSAPPEQLVRRAVELGMTHLALTEINGLWGFINFNRLATEAGLAPVCGARVLLGQQPDSPPAQDVLLLVETAAGYANLCRLLSLVHAQPDGDIVAMLATYGAGLLTLCPAPELLYRLVGQIPPDRLYGELRPGMDTTPMLTAVAELGLMPVATGAVCMLEPDDLELYQMLRAIDRNARLSELPPWELASSDRYFSSEETIRNTYPHCPEVVDNAGELALRCKTDWDFSAVIFPGMQDGSDGSTRLRELVYLGAARRYPSPLAEPVVTRIEHELDLICRKGFAPYFLVVADIVNQNRLTIGRGSGAASIVSYCLLITQVDPIKYNLMFERFLHEERTDLPDIDVDFAWDERDAILDYVFTKYGLHKTAMVANHVTLQPRSAIREVGKVLGLSNEEILAVTRRIALVLAEAGHPNGSSGAPLLWDRTEFSIRGSVVSPTLNIDDTLQKVISLALRMIGVFHYPSVHPGGVVIVPDEIRKYVPVLTAPKGVQIVQWEKDQVESAGLVKIDLLGNRSLAVLRDCLKHINLYRPPNQHLDYHQIRPADDPDTSAMLEQGHTMGIFYVESPATRQLLTKAGVADFEHVVIYSSIIRPAANRFTNLLIERIHGAPWQLEHPDLDFLRESYGIMVYEEQVFMAARVMAGFSYTDADTLRKIGTKRSLRPRIPALKEQFISQAIIRGYQSDLVLEVWAMIESFQGYSFCKPHSASFAMLSFTNAYLKAHFPAEFLAAVISNRGGYYSPYAYMSEARRWGVTIYLPHINRSWQPWKGHNGKIRIGFMEIKSLQQNSIAAILTERKTDDFASLTDFLARVKIPMADCRALVRAGCFDELAGGSSKRPEMLLEIMEHYAVGSQGPETGPLSGLAGQLLHGGRRKVTLRPLTPRQLFNIEVETFGFPISWHPLEPFKELLHGRTISALQLAEHVGQTVTLAGVCLTTKTVKTRQGEPMEFLTFEDQQGLFECVLFPAQYEQFNDLVRWERLFLIRGKVELAWGVHTVTITKMASLIQTMEKWHPGQSASRAAPVSNTSLPARSK